MKHEPISRRKRLRGRLVVVVRRGLTDPLSRRVPLWVPRGWHHLRRRVRPSRYTDADPFACLAVDPARIGRSLLEAAPSRPQWGRVVDGDWDELWEPFDERAVPQGIEQRFEEGRNWPETALYDAYVDQLERFGNAWGYSSIEGFERRCNEIERLYESIERNGYRKRAELEERGASIGTRTDEINVDIGRDGTIYWRTYGQHRLAIAKLLDVEGVPVIVQRRHRAWQRVRERARRRGIETVDDEYRGHPDLEDIAGESA